MVVEVGQSGATIQADTSVDTAAAGLFTSSLVSRDNTNSCRITESMNFKKAQLQRTVTIILAITTIILILNGSYSLATATD